MTPIDQFEMNVIIDRLEGWELVDFLQVPIEQVLLAAFENDWLDEETLQEVLEFVGVKK